MSKLPSHKARIQYMYFVLKIKERGKQKRKNEKKKASALQMLVTHVQAKNIRW